MNNEQMDNLMDDLRLTIEELEATSWSSGSLKKAIAALQELISKYTPSSNDSHPLMQ